jgi:ArsR family transcriptional regulator
MVELKDKLSAIHFDEKSRILKAISHPVRLKILFGVSSKQCNVKSMWQCLDMPQDVVSQHLAVLRKKNILITEKRGNSVFYSVNRELDISGLLEFLKK